MKLLNIIGFIAFLYAGFSTVANSMPLNEEQCRAFANDAVTVAIARDDGVKKQELIDILLAYIQDVPVNSYIKESAHVWQILEMIEEAYLSPQHPLVFGAEQYDACVKNWFDSEV
jgi:hypothetical protein